MDALNSGEIDVNFGDQEDQLKLVVTDTLPTGGNVDGFIKEMLSNPKKFGTQVPKPIAYLPDVRTMLRKCAEYKRRGVY